MSLRKLLPVVFLLGGISSAQAEKVLLYGIQRGCQIDESITKAVEQQLTSSAYSVVRLDPAAPTGQAQAAAEQVTRACPGISGRLLGGFLDENQGFKRVRLWLMELESRRITVADDYCTDCDLAERVALAAARLADKPHKGGAPTPTPTYCQTEPAQAAAPVRSSKLAVVVYGDPKPRGAVWSAVRSAVQGTGRDVAQAHGETKSFGPSDLRKMIREPNGQVLGIELTSEGASVWVFDGPTERTQPMNVACQACDREELGRKVSLAALAVLDTCFDPQCAETGKGTPMRPPASACAELKEPKCSDGDLSLIPGGRLDGRLDPKSAKIIKGLTWGAFAASAATTVAMFSVNATDAATFTGPNGVPVSHSLWYSAWTAAGISAGLLAVAIPITALVDRKSPAPSSTQSSTASMTPLAATDFRCPN